MFPDDTFTVVTPGGLPLYFRAPAGFELRNTAGRLGRLIDTRAHGGYVVAPGSIVGARRYRILRDKQVVELPRWLVHRLMPAPSPTATPPMPLGVPARGRLPASDSRWRIAQSRTGTGRFPPRCPAQGRGDVGAPRRRR
ncbi:bifunctional DNA primase/polymerase [Nocardia sp. R16R-3T]